MNKRVDARRDTHGVTERSDATEDKRFGAKTYFFITNLDKRVSELTRLRNEGACGRGCFDLATIFYTELTKQSPRVTRLYVCS